MNAWRRQPVRSNGCTSQLVCACVFYLGARLCTIVSALFNLKIPARARARRPVGPSGTGSGTVGARAGPSRCEPRGARREAPRVPRRAARDARDAGRPRDPSAEIKARRSP